MNKETAIYEIDVQYDFSFRDGALFVHANKPEQALPYGAEEKLPNIFELRNNAEKEGWLVLGSVDRHFYEDAELVRNEGGVFQDHCMNGTKGQLRLRELEPQKDIYIRRKDGPFLGIRIYTEAELENYLKAGEKGMHLIFEKQNYDVATNPNFEATMKLALDKGLKRIVVNGFATDYCVKAAVLAIAQIKNKYQKELEIDVVTDAIEEVDIDFTGKVDSNFGNKALEEMAAAGAKLITTKQVLEERI